MPIANMVKQCLDNPALRAPLIAVIQIAQEKLNDLRKIYANAAHHNPNEPHVFTKLGILKKFLYEPVSKLCSLPKPLYNWMVRNKISPEELISYLQTTPPSTSSPTENVTTKLAVLTQTAMTNATEATKNLTETLLSGPGLVKQTEQESYSELPQKVLFIAVLALAVSGICYVALRKPIDKTQTSSRSRRTHEFLPLPTNSTTNPQTPSP